MRGFGEDHKDRFRLIGTFCPETKTMQITWSYRVSTRRLNHLIFSICMYNYIFIQNQQLNDEHQLHLKWNSDRNRFCNTSDQKSTDSSFEQFEMTLFVHLDEEE